MSYLKQPWEKGSIISKQALEHSEDGIYNVSVQAGNLGISADKGPMTHHIIGGELPTNVNEAQRDELLVTVGALKATIGQANGIAPLNSNGVILSQYLPSYVDEILEYPTKNNFPSGQTDDIMDDKHNADGPEPGKIYVDLSTGRTYRWGGSEYVEVGIVHLDYADIDYPETNPTTTDWNKYYVKRVTQADGQIATEHAEFAPSISWVGATSESGNNNSDKPRITFSVGGNSAITGDPNIATTLVYGVTKLNDTLDSSSTELAATANTVKVLKDTINALDYNDDNTDENNGTASQGTSFGANDTKFVEIFLHL